MEVEGDQNTRYFHAYASNLKIRNTIEIVHVDGVAHTDQGVNAEIFRDFYIQLIGTAHRNAQYIGCNSTLLKQIYLT